MRRSAEVPEETSEAGAGPGDDRRGFRGCGSGSTKRGIRRGHDDRIAEVAGVSVGTIYQYFANKEHLFDDLIRSEIEAVLEVLQGAALDSREPIAVALQQLLRLLIQARPDAPSLYRSLEQVPNALFRRRLAAVREGVIAWVRAFLAFAPAEINVPDLDVAAFVIVAAAEGVAGSASQEFYRARAANELTTMLTRYLDWIEPMSQWRNAVLGRTSTSRLLP